MIMGVLVGPLVFFSIFRTFFFSPFLVEGKSMLPTLQSGEVFLVDRLTYRAQDPVRDDIVVFWLNEDPSYFYVKRIIGVPGDQIHLEKDGVYLVDAKTSVRTKLSEPFLMPNPHPSEHFLSDANELGQDFTVPAGRYFMMGDNRENSKDSRFFKDPFVPHANIVGKFGFEIKNPLNFTL